MATNGVLNVRDTMLTNMYMGQGSNNLSKQVGPWTWNKDFGSSVVPYATPVPISGSTDNNVNINNLTKVNTNTCSCVKQNWFPIVSDCCCASPLLFGGMVGFSAMPAEYYTRVGQADDKTEALRIYSHTPWSTIIKGSLKNNLIDMMSTPSGTAQTFGLAATGFKGACNVLGGLVTNITEMFS